ncbi:MAG: hypothetical protein R8G01_09020 [Ilumatobacteraceae bacterium]|nr:hypothetical protein [Ilumatobacteraceae bacterium]
MSTERDDLLSTYLEDHRAGAAGGVSLARRLADRYGDEPDFASLVSLADEIDDDRRALDIVREGVGADGGCVKRLGAVVGERLARLKLNGNLVRPSPLSRVVELEALIAGVVGKQLGWRSLRTYAGSQRLAGVDLAELDSRADAQVAELQRLHRLATSIAFVGGEESDGSCASNAAKAGT